MKKKESTVEKKSVKDNSVEEMVEEVAVEDVIEEPIDEEDDVDEVVIDKKNLSIKEISSGEQDVKIRMNKNHRMCVAGVNYCLEKDKIYTVPKNVKFILNKAGFLSPL